MRDEKLTDENCCFGEDAAITDLDAAIHQAQELVRRYVPQDVSLVDELREARRKDITFVKRGSQNT